MSEFQEIRDVRERLVALEEQAKAHKEVSASRYNETKESFNKIFDRLEKLPCAEHTDVDKQIAVIQWTVGILIVIIGWVVFFK